MTKRKTALVRCLSMAVAVALLCAFGVTQASADTQPPFTSTLDFTAASGTGTSAGNWGTVTVTLADSTHATINFSAASGFLFGDGNSLDVNINAATFSFSSPTVTQLSGFSSPSPFSTTHSGQNVDSVGSFNLEFDASGGYGNAFQTATFTVANTSGTWTNASNVLALNGVNGYDAAAHIFVCAVVGTNSCSPAGTSPNTFFVGEDAAGGGQQSSVPEPTSIALLGGVVVGVVKIIRKKAKA